MGAAVLHGALANGTLQGAGVLVVDVDERARHAAQRLGVHTSDQPADALGAPHLLLAVKPQNVPPLLGALAETRGLVISVMAGYSAATLARALPAARVVRAMPNLPAQIGRGITAVAVSPGQKEHSSAEQDLAFVERLFAGVGQTVRVPEELLDAVTAVSGSGPAYLFLLAEAMTQAARDLGLDDPTARALVAHTLAGSGALLAQRSLEAQDSQDAAALRSAVTSPGGTTEAALRVLKQRGFVPAVVEALTAARDRGRELGR